MLLAFQVTTTIRLQCRTMGKTDRWQSVLSSFDLQDTEDRSHRVESIAGTSGKRLFPRLGMSAIVYRACYLTYLNLSCNDRSSTSLTRTMHRHATRVENMSSRARSRQSLKRHPMRKYVFLSPSLLRLCTSIFKALPVMCIRVKSISVVVDKKGFFS
jgi:hypothetical protein